MTSRLSFQPVDAGYLESRLVDLAEGGPAGRAGDFGGHEDMHAGEIEGVHSRESAGLP